MNEHAKPRRWRADAFAVAALVALWASVFHRQFHGAETLAHGDTLLHSVPMHALFGDFVQHGFRFWIHEMGFGYPLYAESSTGFFHPAYWLCFGLLPWSRASDLLLTLPFLAVPLLAFAIARRERLGAPLALGAALVVAGAPALISTTLNESWSDAMIWSALALLAFEDFDRSPTLGRAGFLSLALALLLLGPYPPLAYASGLWIGASFAIRLAVRRERVATRLVAFAAAWAAAVGLSAVQWLPLLELVSNSLRSQGVQGIDVLPWRGWLAGAVLWTDPAELAVDRGTYPSLGSVLAAAGLVLVPWLRGAVAWSRLVLLAVFAALAAGPSTPIYDGAARLLPGFGSLRMLHFFPLVAIVPAALLLAQAVDELRRRGPSPGRTLVGLVLLGGWIVLAGPGLLRSPPPAWGLAVAAALLGLFAAGAIACLRTRRHALPWLFLGVAVAETLALKLDPVAFFPRTIHDESPAAPVLRAAQADGPLLRAAHVSNRTFNVTKGAAYFGNLRDPAQVQRLRFLADVVFPVTSIRSHVALALNYEALPLLRRMVLAGRIQDELRGSSPVLPGHRVIDRFRVSSVIVPGLAGATPLAPDLEPLADVGLELVHLAANRHVGPVVQVYTDVQRVHGLEEALRAVAQDHAGIVVEEAPVRGLPPAVEAVAGRLPWGAPEKLGPFHVDAPSDGFAFVPVPIYPGWSVRVDGREMRPLPAEVLGMAVPVGAGPHEIELAYAPLGFRVGALVSGLCALGAAVFVAWRWRALRSEARAPRDARRL